MNLCRPIVPRNADGVVRAIIPGRISRATQDQESIASQQEDAEAWLRREHDGPIVVEPLGEQASGWLANRASMVAAQELIATGKWDVVVVTEVREIYRNPGFLWNFVFYCVDHDVRFISIADHVDTACEDWENMMYTATLRHGMTVPETRRRVHCKATHSFARGGMVLKVKYGYRRLTKKEAASGAFGTPNLRITKLPECTPHLHEMRRRVMQGNSYVQVAEWLRDTGIATGPYVQNGVWTDRLVEALLRDPILSGQRTFRNQLYEIVYGTGKRRPRPNPDGPEVRQYPELAHMTPDEHAELLAVMNARKTRGKKGQRSGHDSPLWNRPRNRSLWPGQHATCSCCMGHMYRYGTFLRCEHSLPTSIEKCWNHVQVDFKDVFTQVLPWMVGVLDKYPEAREKLTDRAWQELELRHLRRQRLTGRFDAQIVQLTKVKDNFVKAIRQGGALDTLVAELAVVEAEIKRAQQGKQQFEGQGLEVTKFQARDQVAANLLDAVTELAHTSPDFAEVLRQLLPVFVIHPVQTLDCGQVRPRARLALWLDEQVAAGKVIQEESVSGRLVPCVRAGAGRGNSPAARSAAGERGTTAR